MATRATLLTTRKLESEDMIRSEWGTPEEFACGGLGGSGWFVSKTASISFSDCMTTSADWLLFGAIKGPTGSANRDYLYLKNHVPQLRDAPSSGWIGGLPWYAHIKCDYVTLQRFLKTPELFKF